MPTKSAPPTTRWSPITLVLAAVIVVLAVIGVVVAAPSGDTSRAGAAGSAAAGTPVVGPLSGLERRTPGDPYALGAVDAPVVMVAYSEFQCPFCGRFARETEPALVHQYVDTGVLRIEWRDFPYLGPESGTAALAGRAAAAQGQFWALHDALYATERKVNSGTLTTTYLTALAGQLGMDTTRFATDMASPEATAGVQADFTQGQQVGVSGTPAFIVNGTPVFGAQPLSEFQHAIDAAAGTAS